MLYTDRRANTTPNTNRRQQGESAPPTNRSRSSAGTYLSRTKMSLFEETAGDGMGMTLDPRPTTGPLDHTLLYGLPTQLIPRRTYSHITARLHEARSLAGDFLTWNSSLDLEAVPRAPRAGGMRKIGLSIPPQSTILSAPHSYGTRKRRFRLPLKATRDSGRETPRSTRRSARSIPRALV